jgi:hypothetical protein
LEVAKRVKKRPRGRSFEKGNKYRILPGETRNPGGRPRLISESYVKRLAEIDPETEVSYAELVARAQVEKALQGDTAAAREIRQATEGQDVNLNRLSDAELLDYITSETSDDGRGQAPRSFNSAASS